VRDRPRATRPQAGCDILLLGAGYLGSELLGFLPPADRITIFDHGRNFERIAASRSFDPGRMRLVAGDLMDRDLVRSMVGGADIVINLTGGGGNAAVVRDLAKYAGTYVTGMENLVRSAERAGAGHLFLSSSISVYPSPPPGEVGEVTEATPPAPSTPYGVLKLAAERILTGSELSFTIFRISNLYGSTELSPVPTAGLFGNAFRAISRGEPLTVDGDGTQTIDYVHVRDACRCFRLLLPGREQGHGQRREVFNLGSGGVRSINDLAAILARIAGERLGRAPGILHRPIEGPVTNYPRMNTGSIHAATGWVPEVKMEDGLTEIFRHLANKGP